jgi:hypothetical protein
MEINGVTLVLFLHYDLLRDSLIDLVSLRDSIIVHTITREYGELHNIITV